MESEVRNRILSDRDTAKELEEEIVAESRPTNDENKKEKSINKVLLRSMLCVSLVLFLIFLIHGGPLVYMICTLAIQAKCFQEIIDVGYSVFKMHGFPWFRSLSWYFLITSNYFFYGESLVDYFRIAIKRQEFLKFLITYHRFISFWMYVVGFVWFVLSLVKNYYMKQFSLFGWTHVALLIIVTQSYLAIQNAFEGLVWMVIPVTLISFNDVGAYCFGKFFGKTPLIHVSPKKTWEGFIGGAVSCIILGPLLAHFLSRYKYLVCPTEYDDQLNKLNFNCTPHKIFRFQEYEIPLYFTQIYVNTYPFTIHTLNLSLFAALIGPFGGFFASGFKRAFNVKDFGQSLPGHGGFMDRFDCHCLMSTFVNVYIHSFIKHCSPEKVLRIIYSMSTEQQITVYNKLGEHIGEE